MNLYIAALLGMMMVAAIVAWLLCRKKSAEKAVKILLFALYFWAIVFAEILVFALVYHFSDS